MTVDEFLRRYRPHLYHFTDERNLPSIRQHGLLAYSELEARGIEIACPGGNDWSHEADEIKRVDGHVHLCLIGHDHPMEWRAHEDGRLGPTRYLDISPQVLWMEGVLGCATVANAAFANVLPIEQALDEMDLEILHCGYVDFSDLELRHRFNEAKKMEIMIPNGIPIDLIRNLY